LLQSCAHSGTTTPLMTLQHRRRIAPRPGALSPRRDPGKKSSTERVVRSFSPLLIAFSFSLVKRLSRVFNMSSASRVEECMDQACFPPLDPASQRCMQKRKNVFMDTFWSGMLSVLYKVE